jgi:hypothetical protein
LRFPARSTVPDAAQVDFGSRSALGWRASPIRVRAVGHPARFASSAGPSAGGLSWATFRVRPGRVPCRSPRRTPHPSPEAAGTSWRDPERLKARALDCDKPPVDDDPSEGIPWMVGLGAPSCVLLSHLLKYKRLTGTRVRCEGPDR